MEGTLVQITERVYYLPYEEDTDRPCLYYIKGEKYSLAIDAGNSRKHLDKFYKAIKECGFRLPDYTVITHWHWDHTFGMAYVAGKTITGAKTHKKLCEVMIWEWSDAVMQERLLNGTDIPMCDTCIKLEYPDRSKIEVVTADVVFEGRLTIDLGDIHCELYERDSTHSRDSVMIYIPEEQILAIGDADCGDHYENQGKYDKNRLQGLIDFIEQIDFTTYLLGHDHPQSKEEALEYLQNEYKKCCHPQGNV